MEKWIDFWAAFLLCLCMFIIGIIVLIAGKKFYVVRPPKGSVIPSAFKALWIGIMNRGNMGKTETSASLRVLLTVCTDAAKPSYQEEYGRKYKTPWNDLFIDELKRGLVACRVFVFYPIYWVVYSQMLNNFVSQGMYHRIPPIVGCD